MTGEMAVMDRSGDLKVMWDSDKEDEVDAARSQFDALLKKGYAAFKVDKKGGQGEQIKKFDPTAEKLIMVPALAGG
jgi:hypothetical protein